MYIQPTYSCVPENREPLYWLRRDFGWAPFVCIPLWQTIPVTTLFSILVQTCIVLMMATVIAEIYLHDRFYHDENHEVAQWAHTHSFIIHDIVHDLEIKFCLWNWSPTMHARFMCFWLTPIIHTIYATNGKCAMCYTHVLSLTPNAMLPSTCYWMKVTCY